MDSTGPQHHVPQRHVIVTGGSRGLGLGIVQTLVAAGYAVTVIARKESAGLTAAMREAARVGTGGGPAGALHFVAFDLADIDAIPRLVRSLRRDRGPIHGLVNNAAIGTDGLLATMPNLEIERLVRLNTVSPIVLTKYVVRTMMADGTGRIVTVGSIVGSSGYNGLSVYAATKASMLGFTKSLAREVGRLGITVNLVAPGFIATDMTQGLGADNRARVARRSAMQHLAEPVDVAEAVAFLLSDKARNITGTTLTVDAGSTA